MATITISRQFGSHGDTVAQILCDRLGYRYFDKNLMLGLASQSGLAPEKLVDLSDEQHRAQGLVERLFSSFMAPQGDPASWAVAAAANAQERLIVERVKLFIRAAHAEGRVVIIGRGGQAVLAGLPGVLHVRLVAPLELRIQRHQQRAGLSAAAARDYVLKRDRDSLDFLRFYYNIDPGDPSLYDLILNTAKITPAGAAELVIAALAYLQAEQ